MLGGICWLGPGSTRSDGSWPSLSSGASAPLTDPPPSLLLPSTPSPPARPALLSESPSSSPGTPPQRPVAGEEKRVCLVMSF